MLDTIGAVVGSVNDVIWSYVLIIVLIGIGFYFTARTGFVQIRYFPEMFKVLRHGITTHKTKGKEISSFQAFCISTASRVGVGNIAGIAIAVVLGGPGAIFWMWVIAIIGSASCFVESTLAQIYKVPYREGGYHGGPAYYIKNALKQPAVAAFFAILITMTFALFYNSVQANTIAMALNDSFNFSPVITGLVLCVFTSMIIFGGAHIIAKAATFMVPIMAMLYLGVALIILFKNIDLVPHMFYLIIHDAFSPQAAVSGGFATVIMTGIKRGLFSNEAGEGSVPNAAACAVTSHPVKQGLVQAFGVFVDTLFICTASAVIVILCDKYEIGGDVTGIALMQLSLSSELGAFAGYFMSFTITLFAFSSIIGNYYYGEVNIGYLSKNKIVLTVFRIFVVGMVFFGSYATLETVWNLADLFMGLLALTNLYAIARLSKFAFIALKDYTKQRKEGKDPKFNPSCLPSQDGVNSWGNEQKYLETHDE